MNFDSRLGLPVTIILSALDQRARTALMNALREITGRPLRTTEYITASTITLRPIDIRQIRPVTDSDFGAVLPLSVVKNWESVVPSTAKTVIKTNKGETFYLEDDLLALAAEKPGYIAAGQFNNLSLNAQFILVVANTRGGVIRTGNDRLLHFPVPQLAYYAPASQPERTTERNPLWRSVLHASRITSAYRS
jgi:hypothetical protein